MILLQVMEIPICMLTLDKCRFSISEYCILCQDYRSLPRPFFWGFKGSLIDKRLRYPVELAEN